MKLMTHRSSLIGESSWLNEQNMVHFVKRIPMAFNAELDIWKAISIEYSIDLMSAIKMVCILKGL